MIFNGFQWISWTFHRFSRSTAKALDSGVSEEENQEEKESQDDECYSPRDEDEQDTP